MNGGRAMLKSVPVFAKVAVIAAVMLLIAADVSNAQFGAFVGGRGGGGVSVVQPYYGGYYGPGAYYGNGYWGGPGYYGGSYWSPGYYGSFYPYGYGTSGYSYAAPYNYYSTGRTYYSTGS